MPRRTHLAAEPTPAEPRDASGMAPHPAHQRVPQPRSAARRWRKPAGPGWYDDRPLAVNSH